MLAIIIKKPAGYSCWPNKSRPAEDYENSDEQLNGDPSSLPWVLYLSRGSGRNGVETFYRFVILREQRHFNPRYHGHTRAKNKRSVCNRCTQDPPQRKRRIARLQTTRSPKPCLDAIPSVFDVCPRRKCEKVTIAGMLPRGVQYERASHFLANKHRRVGGKTSALNEIRTERRKAGIVTMNYEGELCAYMPD